MAAMRDVPDMAWCEVSMRAGHQCGPSLKTGIELAFLTTLGWVVEINFQRICLVTMVRPTTARYSALHLATAMGMAVPVDTLTRLASGAVLALAAWSSLWGLVGAFLCLLDVPR